MTTEYYTTVARYDTTKTSTTDIQVATEMGLLQIRIVESANGHKRDVFAGFAEARETVPMNDAEIAAWMEEQRYVQQARKAVNKWFGKYETLGWRTFDDIVAEFELGDDLRGDVLDKVSDALGYKPTPETAAQREAREKQEWAQKELAAQDRIADAIANDDQWGIF